MCAIPAGLYVDMVVANATGGRWSWMHTILVSVGSVGALWLSEELDAAYRVRCEGRQWLWRLPDEHGHEHGQA
jgi:hypothetical protein